MRDVVDQTDHDAPILVGNNFKNVVAIKVFCSENALLKKFPQPKRLSKSFLVAVVFISWNDTALLCEHHAKGHQ